MTKTVPVKKADSAPVSMFPTSASINAAAAKSRTGRQACR